MACIPVYKGKRFPSTEKLIEYLSTEEGMMAHLADGKDTEFIKAIEGVVGATEKTTPTPKPASLADQIADLRAKEQAEYDAMPDPNDKAKRKEIYDRYDKPISDLLAQQKKEEGKQQTNDSKNKPRVSGEVGVGQESVQAEPVEGGGATQTQAGGNVQGNEKAEVKPTVEEKLSMDDFDSFKDAVAYNVGRTAKIGLDESNADYGTNQDISAISPILEKAGIPIEKTDKSKMADGNYASFDGNKIKITESNIPLPVLLHEIGEYVIDALDKAKTKIKHSNNIFEAVTTYGASRGNDAFADNFYLYFLSPETLKDLSPNVYKELDIIIPEEIKTLGKNLMKVYGVKEQTLKYNNQKTSTPSPLTAFQTKGEAGRKAREALKEEVGPEEFKRMDNIHRNGEKMLKEMQAKGILEIRCP
jgi:hypothetical protein